MMMSAIFKTIKGAGLGAAVSYLFDPVEGRKRRAAIRDHALQLVSAVEGETQYGWRDLVNRTKACWADAQSRFLGDGDAESQLAATICQRLGHFISRPDLIDVTVHGTRAKLTGKVLATELNDAMAAVMAVPEVSAVDQRLDVYDTIDELSKETVDQAHQCSNAAIADIPAVRLLAGAAGLLLASRAIGVGRTLGIIAATTATVHLLRKSAEFDVADRGPCEPKSPKLREPVDEALDESFPASDPPSFTSSAASRSAEPGELAEDTPWKTPPVES